MSTPTVVRVNWCQLHYDQLLMGLNERGLQEFVSQTPEELQNRLVNGKRDAAFEAETAVTRAAFQMFGVDAIMNYAGCPVCTFQNVLNIVSDSIVPQFRKTS